MTTFDLRRWAHSTVFFATLGAVAYAAAGASQSGYVPERFTAQAVNRGETTATPSRVELRVDRWSTDVELADYDAEPLRLIDVRARAARVTT